MTIEDACKAEALETNQIVIWLHATNDKSSAGEIIWLVKSYSPFHDRQLSMRREKALDEDENGDILLGYKFSATMQFRTPPSVLKQHGRIEKKPKEKLPKIARDIWQGSWVPITGSKPYDPNSRSAMASEIGYIPNDGGDFLRFLLYVHHVNSLKIPLREKSASLDLAKNFIGQDGTPFTEFLNKFRGQALELFER